MKTQALLGYMAINIYRPPDGAFWGAFNDRVLIETWVKGLVNQFQSDRLNSCIDDTAIELAVKPKWIANLGDKLEHVSRKDIEEVPVISFTEEGLREILHPSWKHSELPPGAGNLWFLGGNHRREALTRFLDDVDSQRRMLSTKVEKITKEMEKSEGGSSQVEELEQANAKLMELTETLKRRGMWAVRLYDRGTRRCY
jgi:hypothetical protein